MDYVSWIIMKDEHQRIDAFELWCWRRLFRVPWTSRRSNQSILKEINPEYSLERLMLKLMLQTLATWCNEPTQLKRLWYSETLRAGGEGSYWGWDGLDGITNSVDMSLSKLRKTVKDRQTRHAAAHGITKSWTQLSDWTTATTKPSNPQVQSSAPFI